MNPTRDVQTSLWPDMVPERPQGWIMPSVFTGTNADLIANIAPMYLTGSVCDVTYGNGATAGGWWRRFTPDPFTFHDVAGDGVDFTDLPEADDTYDAVTFDPPYIPQGGTNNTDDEAINRFRSGFGLRTRTETYLWHMIGAGLAECARITRPGGFVVTKCTDYVSSERMTWGHVRMMELAADVDMVCHDLIVHHTGSGPGGHNIFTPKRARRHHSYLLVFTKPVSRA